MSSLLAQSLGQPSAALQLSLACPKTPGESRSPKQVSVAVVNSVLALAVIYSAFCAGLYRHVSKGVLLACAETAGATRATHAPAARLKTAVSAQGGWKRGCPSLHSLCLGESLWLLQSCMPKSAACRMQPVKHEDRGCTASLTLYVRAALVWRCRTACPACGGDTSARGGRAALSHVPVVPHAARCRPSQGAPHALPTSAALASGAYILMLATPGRLVCGPCGPVACADAAHARMQHTHRVATRACTGRGAYRTTR